ASTNACTIGAGSLPSGSGAGDVILADRCGRPPADAANRFPGQEMLGTTAGPELRCASLGHGGAIPNLPQPRFFAGPQIFVYDAQLGYIAANQVLTRIDSRDPTPCRRIFGISQSIPDKPPLLRARRTRPRGHRSAEQRYEFTAFEFCAHSITSSAATCRLTGTGSPSALAVLRFIVSPNLIGCTTGRSAGFRP